MSNEAPALAAVPDDGGVQLDVQELLDAHAKIASEQIIALINRCASLEATVSALQRRLASRGKG